MPIYAYRCASCGFEKDVLQKISDAPLTQCPQCGADAFRKQVTAAGFQLKGSGWYVTDFRGGNNGGGAAAKPAGDGNAAGNNTGGGAAGNTGDGTASSPAGGATASSSGGDASSGGTSASGTTSTS